MGWDESVLVSSQVIAKSAKLLPVMAMGRLLGDKHYSVSPAPSPPGVHGSRVGIWGWGQCFGILASAQGLGWRAAVDPERWQSVHDPGIARTLAPGVTVCPGARDRHRGAPCIPDNLSRLEIICLVSCLLKLAPGHEFFECLENCGLCKLFARWIGCTANPPSNHSAPALWH